MRLTVGNVIRAALLAVLWLVLIRDSVSQLSTFRDVVQAGATPVMARPYLVGQLTATAILPLVALIFLVFVPALKRRLEPSRLSRVFEVAAVIIPILLFAGAVRWTTGEAQHRMSGYLLDHGYERCGKLDRREPMRVGFATVEAWTKRGTCAM